MISKVLIKFHSNNLCHKKCLNASDTGRGMRATRDIKCGEVIMSIPAHFFIDTCTIRESDVMQVIKGSVNLLFSHRLHFPNYERVCDSASHLN